jgi:hypothetical protein
MQRLCFNRARHHLVDRAAGQHTPLVRRLGLKHIAHNSCCCLMRAGLVNGGKDLTVEGQVEAGRWCTPRCLTGDCDQMAGLDDVTVAVAGGRMEAQLWWASGSCNRV